MKNTVNKALGIVLYILAGALIVYTIWAAIHCAGYISEIITSGQITFAGNEYDIVSFYMGSCTQYFVFAALLAVAGFMLYGKASSTEMTIIEQSANAAEDDDLDELFAAAEPSDEKNGK